MIDIILTATQEVFTNFNLNISLFLCKEKIFSFDFVRRNVRLDLTNFDKLQKKNLKIVLTVGTKSVKIPVKSQCYAITQPFPPREVFVLTPEVCPVVGFTGDTIVATFVKNVLLINVREPTTPPGIPGSPGCLNSYAFCIENNVCCSGQCIPGIGSGGLGTCL